MRAYYTRMSRFRRVRSSSAHYTHIHTYIHSQSRVEEKEKRGGNIYVSFFLYASRTAVSVSRNQRLRFLLIDLILSPLSLSLPFCGPVVVSPSAPRCPTSFRPVFNETRRQRETNGESTTDQPIQSINRTTLSTVHYRSTTTSVH